jgi:hypothetical protein
MDVRYPAGDLYQYPPYSPSLTVRYHHPSPLSHPILPSPHISTNGYNILGFNPLTNTSFTSTSTFIISH